MATSYSDLAFSTCRAPDALFSEGSCSKCEDTSVSYRLEPSDRGEVPLRGLKGGGTPGQAPPFWTSAGLRQAAGLFAKAAQLSGVEKSFRIVKVPGDGRCMFRALAKGLAKNRGLYLGGENETKEADGLRLAVYDAICRNAKRKKEFDEVSYTVKHLEGGFRSYCKRLRDPGFWGGEVEILVLSKMLHVPIYIYKTAEEAGRGSFGYVPIVRYGEEFSRVGKQGQGRAPVRLLYSSGNHYDLLL